MFAAMLFFGASAQEKYVVVETTYGESVVCQFNENPRLTHQNDYVVLSTTKAEIRYQTKEIAKAYVYDGIKTGIEQIKGSGEIHADGERITLRGFSPNDKFSIYTVQGMLVASRKVDSNGDATIYMSELENGVNIVKTRNQTFKIIKK